MKTQVIMKRELFGKQISQQSDTQFFSATDLERIGNAWRLANNMSILKTQDWLKQKKTKEFIIEVENKYGIAKTATRGRNAHIWLHPLLFIDMALTISPKLKIEVYEWLFDHLIKNRNESGDSYKKMCGMLWVHTTNKRNFSNDIAQTALLIKNRCKVKDWQQATEKQLTRRDRIHENIALLADVLNNNKEAIRIGILKSEEKL